MKLNKGLSAYPILCEGDNDYTDGTFTAQFTLAADHASVDVALQLTEPAIQGCLDDGTAACVLHVECPMTSYRKKYVAKSAHATLPLPLDELAGETEISTYLIAVQDIHGFTSAHLNAAYQGRPLLFPQGSLLAIGSIYTLDITRDGSGAQQLPDIFRIYGDLPPEKKDKKSYWIDLTPDTIDIHVTPRVKAFYAEHPAQKYLLNDLLILPAATYALTAVAAANDAGEESSHADDRWYKIFDETLKKSGLAMARLTNEANRAESADLVAHKLFRQPLESAIDALAELVDRPEDD